MATSDVDQKILGRLAGLTAISNPVLSSSLYQVLGLSVVLSRKLLKARKLRKLDTSRDTKSLALYQHIIWLSREGLTILEVGVLPYTKDGIYGPESLVLSNKLRASFYHVFCLFHNQPPVSQLNIPSYVTSNPASAPLSARQDNNQTRINGAPNQAQGETSPTKQSQTKASAGLRDPIPSMTSDASYLTNPYGTGGPVGTPSPSYPPGLPPGLANLTVPQPSAFLLPSMNFLPRTSNYFTAASNLAAQLLPGSHPLRLSVALEHAAFLWDCVHEHEGARKLSRRAIREVYRATEGMEDSEFEDAAELVGVLGRMMRRSSWEGTPRTGLRSADGTGSSGAAAGPGAPGTAFSGFSQGNASVSSNTYPQQQNGYVVTPQSGVRAAVDPNSTPRASAPMVSSSGDRRPGSGQQFPLQQSQLDGASSPRSLHTAVPYVSPPSSGEKSRSSRGTTVVRSAETTPRPPGYLPPSSSAGSVVRSGDTTPRLGDPVMATSPGGQGMMMMRGSGAVGGADGAVVVAPETLGLPMSVRDGKGDAGSVDDIVPVIEGGGSGGSLTPRPGGPVRTPEPGSRIAR